MKKTMACAVVLAAVFSCGGGSEEQPTPDERTAADRGAQSSNLNQGLLTLSDSFFDFDPTLDTAKTAAENAQAIAARTSLSFGGCGTVTPSGTSVTVSMPPPGCTTSGGLNAQGTVALAVTKSTGTPATLTVALTLTSVVVNGVSYGGTASFATTNGSTFTVTADLTSGDAVYAMNLTVTGAPGSMTIAGSMSQGQGATGSSYTFTNVLYKKADCYPSGGSLAVKKGLVTTTITFTAATANTGQVTVTSGRKSWPSTLPAYGSCPKGADGG